MIFISYIALPHAHAHSTGLAPVPSGLFPTNSYSLKRQKFYFYEIHERLLADFIIKLLCRRHLINLIIPPMIDL